MADDYLNAPFTIVKEIQVDQQSSDVDKQYQWITSGNYNTLTIQVNNISLKQFPHETLNMQVDISPAVVECCESRDIYMSSANRSIYERHMYNYSYQLKLQFQNYLHEFNQNCCYEVICKLSNADTRESEYLFGCMQPRLKESISFEEKFLVVSLNLTRDPKPNLCFYIRRLDNYTNKTIIDDIKMHEVISTFRNTGYDVILDAKDGRLSAHKAILSQNSEVFQAMFSADMKESQNGIVSMLEFEVRVVKKMLDFLYTRQLEELEDMTESLFKLAHRYQMHDLCRRCEEYYTFNVKVDNNSIVEILKLADVYELEKLRECATNFANRHEMELFTLESYREYLVQSIDLDNAVAILLLVDKYSAADVKVKIFNFIKDNYQKMIGNPDFLELFESQGRLMKEIHVHLYK